MADQMDEENISIARVKKFLADQAELQMEKAAWLDQDCKLPLERDEIFRALHDHTAHRAQLQRDMECPPAENKSTILEQIIKINGPIIEFNEKINDFKKRFAEHKALLVQLNSRTIMLNNEAQNLNTILTEIARLFLANVRSTEDEIIPTLN